MIGHMGLNQTWKTCSIQGSWDICKGWGVLIVMGVDLGSIRSFSGTKSCFDLKFGVLHHSAYL